MLTMLMYTTSFSYIIIMNKRLPAVPAFSTDGTEWKLMVQVTDLWYRSIEQITREDGMQKAAAPIPVN